MDVDTIRDAIGTALDTISGLRVAPYFGSQVVPPAAAVALPDVEYDTTKGAGEHRLEWTVWIVVGRPTERSAEARLADFLSTGNASSVHDVIEGDATLAAAVASVSVLTATPEVFSIAGVEYLSASFTIETLS